MVQEVTIIPFSISRVDLPHAGQIFKTWHCGADHQTCFKCDKGEMTQFKDKLLRTNSNQNLLGNLSYVRLTAVRKSVGFPKEGSLPGITAS